ncbi:MAG: ADP-ribosylglycohydrolase family protein [Bacillales bacterium]|nr:ADP-ribosylglycohydrolase family protein [Bacillales bacterium]
MLGAIIGDISGSFYEGKKKTDNAVILSESSTFTDDSVLTIAISKAILESKDNLSALKDNTIKNIKDQGRLYINAGYGLLFRRWLLSDEINPYGSFGNGGAMRISPVAYFSRSIEEVKKYSKIVTSITHNHKDAIEAAEAVSSLIFLSLHGASMRELRLYAENYYNLDFKIDEVKEKYEFNASAKESVPYAIEAFLESSDFTSAIKKAISLGGDTDTIASITGSIAEAYYGIDEKTRRKALHFLNPDQIKIILNFEQNFPYKKIIIC